MKEGIKTLKSLKKVKTTKRKSNGFGITNFFGREQGIRSLTLKGNTDLADLTIDKFNDVELHLYGTGEKGEKVVDTTRKTVSKDPAIVVEELKTQDNLTLDYRELNITVEEPLKMVKTKTGITISIDLPNVEPRPETRPEFQPEESPKFGALAPRHIYLVNYNEIDNVLSYELPVKLSKIDYVSLVERNTGKIYDVQTYHITDGNIDVDLKENGFTVNRFDHLMIGYSDDITGFAMPLQPVEAVAGYSDRYRVHLPELPVADTYSDIVDNVSHPITVLSTKGQVVTFTGPEHLDINGVRSFLIRKAER